MEKKPKQTFPVIYKYNNEKAGFQAKFYAPNGLCAGRYKTLFRKEPETIKWMSELRSDDVLWDVGANVGIYTVFAATVINGLRVVAIEPGAGNYVTLCTNIQLNALDQNVIALCLALGDEHKVADLYLSSTKPGGAQNAIDRPLNDAGQVFKPQFRQGMISIPADTLVEHLGAAFPSAMKIDVDGFELPLLRGAKRLLANPNLRRISLELNSSNEELVRESTRMVEAGGLRKVGEYRSDYAPGSPIHNFHFERP